MLTKDIKITHNNRFPESAAVLLGKRITEQKWETFYLTEKELEDEYRLRGLRYDFVIWLKEPSQELWQIVAPMIAMGPISENGGKIYSPVDNWPFKDNQPCGYQPDKVFQADKNKFTPSPKFGGFPLDKTKNDQ